MKWRIASRSGRAQVDRLRRQWEDAARAVAAGDAVFRLAAAQGRDPAEGLDVRQQVPGQSGSAACARANRRSASVNSPTDMWRSPRKMSSWVTCAGRPDPGDRRQPAPAAVDRSPLASPLVRRPDLLERLRVRDRPREPDGQPLATILGPVLGEERNVRLSHRVCRDLAVTLTVREMPVAARPRPAVHPARVGQEPSTPPTLQRSPPQGAETGSPRYPAAATCWMLFDGLTLVLRSESDLRKFVPTVARYWRRALRLDSISVASTWQSLPLFNFCETIYNYFVCTHAT